MNRISFKFLLIATILLSVSVSVCGRKERNVPHGHHGLLRAYEAGPFDLSLKASEEQDLSSGKAVMKQVMPTKGEDDSGGGVFCVQDIAAPKQAVWNQILRMDEYTKKVAKVIECKNYEVQRNKDGSITMKTRQKLGVLPGYSVSTCTSILVSLQHSYSTFKLTFNILDIVRELLRSHLCTREGFSYLAS